MNKETPREFPPVKQLFSDSWQTFTQSALSLFAINIIGIIIELVVVAIAVIAFIISGAGSALLQKGIEGLTASLLSPANLITSAVLAVVVVIVLAVIFSALQIATILIVDAKGKMAVGETIRKSFGLVLPVFLVGFLTGFLTLGSFFVFVFPVILVSFLLGFVHFEIILNNQRWLEAVKRSVLLISKNFGAIFIRTILLWLLYFVVFIVMTMLENLFPEDSQWVVSIFSFFVNLFLGWFALCYQIILYKHAASGMEGVKGKSITWIWILAIVGWLMAIGLGFGSYKLISSELFKNIISKNQTTQSTMNEQAKAYVDQSQGFFDQMIANKNNPEMVKKLNDQNLAVLKKALELEPNSAKIYFELGNAYTWLSTEGTLEDGLAAYEAAEKLEPNNITYIDNTAGMLIRLKRYDEAVLKLQKSIRVAEESGTESGFTHYSLGLAYAGLKINDSARTHLQKAIDILSAKNKDGRFDDDILRAQQDLSNLPK